MFSYVPDTIQSRTVKLLKVRRKSLHPSLTLFRNVLIRNQANDYQFTIPSKNALKSTYLSEAMQHPDFQGELVLREQTVVLQVLEKCLRDRKIGITSGHFLKFQSL
jgi:hypothetical protein